MHIEYWTLDYSAELIFFALSIYARQSFTYQG